MLPGQSYEPKDWGHWQRRQKQRAVRSGRWLVTSRAGLSGEFYERIKGHYDDPQAWNYGERLDFQRTGWDEGPGYHEESEAMFHFEPHVAELVFDNMFEEAGVTVVGGQRLDRENGVSVKVTGEDFRPSCGAQARSSVALK